MGRDLTPTRTGKIKRPTVTSVDEAVEKSTLEWKMIRCFGKQFGNSSKCQTSNYHVYVPSVHSYIYTQGNENMCPLNNLYVSVHSSIIHSNPKVETTQIVHQLMNG